MSLTRIKLLSYLSTGPMTVQSNFFLELNHLGAQSTTFLNRRRRPYKSILKKIYLKASSDTPSHQLVLLCSLSRRRMVLSAYVSTIRGSIVFQSRIDILCH